MRALRCPRVRHVLLPRCATVHPAARRGPSRAAASDRRGPQRRSMAGASRGVMPAGSSGASSPLSVAAGATGTGGARVKPRRLACAAPPRLQPPDAMRPISSAEPRVACAAQRWAATRIRPRFSETQEPAGCLPGAHKILGRRRGGGARCTPLACAGNGKAKDRIAGVTSVRPAIDSNRGGYNTPVSYRRDHSAILCDCSNPGCRRGDGGGSGSPSRSRQSCPAGTESS